MELSCCDYSFPAVGHGAAFQIIRALGFRRVDLGISVSNGTYLTPSDVLERGHDLVKSVSSALEAAELDVSDLFVILGNDYYEYAVNSPDPAQAAEGRHAFGQCAYFAKAIGAPGITILPGVFWPDEAPAASIRRAEDELRWRVQSAQKHGLALSVEPHVGSIVESPGAAEELVHRVSGLQLTTDCSHFVCQGYVTRDVQRLIGLSRHFHARQAAKGWLQAPSRQGTVDFEWLVRQCQSIGYEGDVSTEYVWVPTIDEIANVAEVDTLAETALLARDLRRLVTTNPGQQPYAQA